MIDSNTAARPAVTTRPRSDVTRAFPLSAKRAGAMPRP